MIDSYLASQYLHAKQFGGLFDFSYRGKIKVFGADRISFLHRMLTNDIASLAIGEGCYAALLTAQSKIITDMNVFIFEDHVLLTVENRFSRQTIATLQKFVIADDVVFEDVSDQIAAIAIFGNDSEAHIKQIANGATLPNRFFSHQPISAGMLRFEIARIPFYGMKAWVFLTGIKQKNVLVRLLLENVMPHPIHLVQNETKEIFRIEAGVPVCGVDFGEHHLLMETGIESRAVSFTKGCYPGQELVARMDSRGQFAKKLALFECSGADSIKPICKIIKDSKEIGQVTSAAYSPSRNKTLAIGTMLREYLISGEAVELADGNQRLPAIILNALK